MAKLRQKVAVKGSRNYGNLRSYVLRLSGCINILSLLLLILNLFIQRQFTKIQET